VSVWILVTAVAVGIGTRRSAAMPNIIVQDVLQIGYPKYAKSDPHGSNDPSSATRPRRAFDCNLDAMAGFAAAHG
jgi:hypothetical protein